MDTTALGISIPDSEPFGLVPQLRKEANDIDGLISGVIADIEAIPSQVADHSIANDRDLLASPLSIPDCVLWAQADHITGTPDGTALSAWSNLAAGGGMIAQSNATYKPVYHITGGVPYVSNVNAGGFDISIPSTDTGLITIFMVMRTNGTNPAVQYRNILNFGPSFGGDTKIVQSSNGDLSMVAAGDFYKLGITLTDKWQVCAFRGNAANTDALGSGVTGVVNGQHSFRHQGSNSVEWNGVTATSGFIGGYQAGFGDDFKGDWRALLIYDRVLTDAEVFRVLSYLHREMAVTYTAPGELLIFDGDSQTVAYVGGIDAPGLTDSILSLRSNFKAYNVAVVGQTAYQVTADAGTQVDPLFDKAIPNRVYVHWAGTNDYFVSHSAADVYASIVACCQARREAGADWIVVCTTLPRGSDAVYATFRTALNALITSGFADFADVVADIGADPDIGAEGQQHNHTYYQGDDAHLTSAGYIIAAGIISDALDTLYTTPSAVSIDSQPAIKGAPSDATYLTQTANSTLPNEFAMGSLATGIVKNTTTTGVPSIATANDLEAPLFAADAGSNDTYVATLSPAIAAYVTGAHYRFKANTANTGAATINFNGLGAKAIKKAVGGITTDVATNDIRAGQWVDLVYDGTNMQMQSTLGNASGGDALTSNPLSQFAPTTSAQLAGVISDETGTDKLVFSDSPALAGTPTAPTAAPGTNTTQIATTAFTKAAIDTAVTGLLEFKGSTDCSANPNYPSASKGDGYIVSVAGKIGGASGKSVDVGDWYVAIADNAGGTEASVGTSWSVLEHNLSGVYVAGGTDVAVADGGTGSSTASGARTNLGLVIGTDIEAHDADLTTIAGLSPSNDDFLQRKSSAWANRTIAQVKSDLGITAASYARVYNSSTIGTTSGTGLFLTFDSERTDTDSYHSTSSNTSRLTAPITGLYHIGGNIKFSPNGAAGTMALQLWVNGLTTRIAEIDFPLIAGITTAHGLQISADWVLSAGDYVEMRVLQDTGAGINIDAQAAFTPEFWIHLLK